ncbi:hypothetical protein L2E82_15013 [Cichorium intybus]|uniref:Uncharacterized protein n=1 Tax=Cichorium intybus TaxID=13427 RepID=A0ACB9F133_CICIN|nr:hypothetical protein L2E82_53733 [Cichorium intybus]KAI3671375.1 hypothetical protein L2E82_53363 [Cichorium intybus]KAI3674283.1 hypothetical protein L2E82_52443 [Cichorium intybus]KAI3764994.1 hypothetical protein L2E82_15013 [Cichorium intybus]
MEMLCRRASLAVSSFARDSTGTKDLNGISELSRCYLKNEESATERDFKRRARDDFERTPRRALRFAAVRASRGRRSSSLYEQSSTGSSGCLYVYRAFPFFTISPSRHIQVPYSVESDLAALTTEAAKKPRRNKRSAPGRSAFLGEAQLPIAPLYSRGS